MIRRATAFAVALFAATLTMRFVSAQGGPTPAAGSGEVMRIVLPEQASPSVAEAQDRLYRVIENQARYLLASVHPWQADAGLKLVTESRSQEHWVRPNTGAVEGFCFLYRFGPYDEKRVGVPRERLLRETIVPMMRYLAATHVAGNRPTSDGKPWGDAWQSAHWAQMLGRGAWWTWGDLPDDLRAAVRRVVAHEADRIARSTPPHQLRADTKAEENAWNSQVLSVAVLLMPGDPRRPVWEREFQRWVLSSFLRPADETCDAVLDGRPVREQFTGANLLDDFTLENHGIVHPDYMTCFSLSLACAADFTMTGRKPPEALLYNVPGIYENLKWLLLPDGGFVYPSGQDWELFRNPAWLAKHVLMAVYGRDPEAWPLALRTLEVAEKMQARSESGAIYYPGEYFFPSTQTDILSSLSRAWLNLALLREGDKGLSRDLPSPFVGEGPGVRGSHSGGVFRLSDTQKPSPQPSPGGRGSIGVGSESEGDTRVRFQRVGVRRLDSAQVIVRRTATAVHTFSWGAKVMALCAPLREDRIVSPDQRSGVGQIILQGSREPLPVKLREVQVENGDDWFRAEVVLDHGKGQVQSHLVFHSRPDGAWSVREKLVAVADVTTTEVATGLIGILNNPHWVYERGRREISMGGQATVVPALSGKTLENEAATEIAIDGVLLIRSPQPLHVRYVGATQPERGRATDRLYLNYLSGPRTWRAGQEISQLEVTVTAQGQ